MLVRSLACSSFLLLNACAVTIEAVAPRPNVALAPESGTMALVLRDIADEQHPLDVITVKEFQESLRSGFKSMAADKYVAGGTGELTLRLTEATVTVAKMMTWNYLTIRYKGQWDDAKGKTIARFAGVAQPRNPSESGPRHLEDAIEVMYEETVASLEKVQGIKVR